MKVTKSKTVRVGPFGITFTKEGREIPDPKPMEIPAGMKRPETLQDQIKRLIRTDVSLYAEEHGAESFDDANDFDIEGEDAEDHPTHHELHEEVVDEVKRVRKESEDAERRRVVRAEEAERGDEEGEGVQETAAEPSERRDDISRPRSKDRPSPQRRPTGRREEGGHSENEISPGRGRPDRRVPRDED